VAGKRTGETSEERGKRVTKNAQDVREATAREDEAMDAMVRNSVKTQGP
jgi:hypothetical protein